MTHETIGNFVVDSSQVIRVMPIEAMQAKVGDVFLVRSSNVGALGNHFLMITGPLVQKPHGLRPDSISFPASDGTLLDHYPNDENPVLLKLDDVARLAFYDEFEIDPKFRR